MLWPVSKRPDSGRLSCSGRLEGVQSLDALAFVELTCVSVSGRSDRVVHRKNGKVFYEGFYANCRFIKGAYWPWVDWNAYTFLDVFLLSTCHTRQRMIQKSMQQQHGISNRNKLKFPVKDWPYV